MCGRTACTLAPDHVVRACGFRSRKGEYQHPVWKDPPGGQQYFPSYNVAPSAHTPVLLSSKHYPGELESFSERVVQPMKWGLVPSWHKGDPYKLEYETNNCRAEGMLTKRTYKTALEKGNRCIVLADGFFEWKRGPEGKQPYFIYFPPSPSHSHPDSKPETKPDCKPDSKPETKPDCKPEIKPQIFAKAASNPVKTDCQLPAPSQAKVKQEPVCVKPDPDGDKPHLQLSAAVPVKREPVWIKPDPDAVSSQPMKKEDQEGKTESSSTAADAQTKELSEIKGERQKEAGEDECDGDIHSKRRKCFPLGNVSLKSELTDDMSSMGNMKPADHTVGEDEEWQGKRLLTMAAVFDVWHPPDGSAPLYSYSVITVEASPAMASIHHRMPAILSTEEEINDWLDFAEVPLMKAVKAIHPSECITMHMVSPLVNNSRNKSPQCVEVYNPKQVKKTASSNLMMNWLKRATPSDHTNTPDVKRQKPN